MAFNDLGWTRSCGGCLTLLAAVVLAGFIAFKIYAHSFEMSLIPDRLTVSEKLYDEEYVAGFGPGGNETGLRVYKLDDDVVRRLRQEAPQLLDGQSIRTAMGRSERRDYEWQPTPVQVDRDWQRWLADDGEDARPNLRAFHGRYGFSISIDPEVEDEVDEAMNTPGSYYSFGRGGTFIIVSPATGKVYLAFAG